VQINDKTSQMGYKHASTEKLQCSCIKCLLRLLKLNNAIDMSVIYGGKEFQVAGQV